VIDVYAFTPPASAERLLEVERRLRAKVAIAQREVGAGDAMLSLVATLESSPSVATAAETLRRLLDRWRGGDVAPPIDRHAVTVAGAVHAPRPGLLALFDGEPPLLTASLDGTLHDDPGLVAEIVPIAGGPSAELPREELEEALAATARFRERRRAALEADVGAVPSGPIRRALVRRISAIAARTPFHLRGQRAPTLAEARHRARAPLGAGAERALEELARATLDDEAWLAELARIAESYRRREDGARLALGALRGLLVLRLEP
jgi:hypothetical protein